MENLSIKHQEIIKLFETQYNIVLTQTNSIKKLSNSFKLSSDNKKIIGLNLDHNNLGLIPSEIFDIDNLEELSMRNCGIIEIPVEITKLKQLRKLNLRSNLISILPIELFSLKKLNYINICHNRIKYLPEEIIMFKEGIFWEKNWNIKEEYEIGIFLEDNPIVCPFLNKLIKYDSNFNAVDIKNEISDFYKQRKIEEVKNCNLYLINFIDIEKNDNAKQLIQYFNEEFKNSKYRKHFLDFSNENKIRNFEADLYKFLGKREQGKKVIYPKIILLLGQSINNINLKIKDESHIYYTVFMSLSTIINKTKGRNIKLILDSISQYEIPRYLQLINNIDDIDNIFETNQIENIFKFN